LGAEAVRKLREGSLGQPEPPFLPSLPILAI
jgi:hypothetical protein